MLTLEEVLNDFADDADLDPAEVTLFSRNVKGETALHYMAYLGDPPAIRILVSNGAEISAVDNQGNSPLHVAVAYRHQRTGHELVKLGANLELRNAADQTPRDVAFLDENVEMVALLQPN